MNDTDAIMPRIALLRTLKANKHLRPYSAGRFHDYREGMVAVHWGFVDAVGLIIDTSQDRNGINLTLLYEDGTTVVKNVNPHMNVFVEDGKLP